jgi:hypothetical protein
MRTSEWIQTGFVSALAVAAWVRPLTPRRRLTVTLLAAGTIVAVALACFSKSILAPVQVSILRDWLPVPLALVPYWQTGQFFVGPNKKIQAWLVKTDRWVEQLASRTGWSFGRITRLTMEWAYMLCYPLVPLGLAVLYLAGLRRDASTYWFLVLVPTYLCYAITPFVLRFRRAASKWARVRGRPRAAFSICGFCGTEVYKQSHFPADTLLRRWAYPWYFCTTFRPPEQFSSPSPSGFRLQRLWEGTTTQLT